MTIIREKAEENKAFPDKIQVTDYCCDAFKDKFLDPNLQYNINFEDKYMDIQVIVSQERTAYTFLFVTHCMNCGDKIRFLALSDLTHKYTGKDALEDDCKLCG
jgi:hypothetical protein